MWYPALCSKMTEKRRTGTNTRRPSYREFTVLILCIACAYLFQWDEEKFKQAIVEGIRDYCKEDTCSYGPR